jgi:hypothetical protein
MTRPNPFDPNNWYIGTGKKKPQKKDESLSGTIDDSMRGIGKLAIGAAGLTLLFGMTKGIGQMFKK